MNTPQSSIVLLILLLLGWVCTKKPTLMVRLLSAHVNLTDQEPPSQSQKIARYIREHPEQWQSQYPALFRLIQLIGRVAYIMFVIGSLILLLSWLTHA